MGATAHRQSPPGTDAPAGDPDVTDPRLITWTEPIYPDEARAARLEASIVLQALIRKDGTVATDHRSCIRCSVNRKDKKPEEVLHGWCKDFCASARDGVSHWTYEPGTRDGEPVDVYFAIVLDYKLP
jgi:hypothetical protein